MRILIVLICSLALAWVAGAQNPPEKKEQPKKKTAPAGQVSQPPGKRVGKPAEAGKPTGAGKPMTKEKPTTAAKPMEVGKPTGAGKTKPTGKSAEVGRPAEVGKATEAGKVKPRGNPTEVGKPAEAGKAAEAGKTKAPNKPAEVGNAAGTGKPTEPGKPGEVATTTAGKMAATGKPVQPQHFNLPQQPNTAKAPPVQFQQGKHIEGSQNWQGQSYTVFRTYTPEWHDQGWWHSHYNNIVFVFGAPYFFNTGYWFPAWGYQPNAYYAYDGPIYASNNLPPDQVIANVQAALQQQGYYQGEIDGLVGPETRGALSAYQRDHGLYETAAIDQPTLQSLGMA
jgi:Putative peptidoglycan binding domain